MAQECLHKFENSWAVGSFEFPWEFHEKSPSFYPLPNSDGQVCFELRHSSNNYNHSRYDLSMLQLAAFNCSPSLEMNVLATLHHEPIFQRSYRNRNADPIIINFEPLSSIKVNNMTCLCFEREYRYTGGTYRKVELKIIFTITFYDRNPISLDRLLISSPKPTQHATFSGQKTTDLKFNHKTTDLKFNHKTTDLKFNHKTTNKSLLPSNNCRQEKRLPEFVRNFKKFYQRSASEISDFVFKLGNKSLPAHRIVLAAQSPVLMKEFTQNSPQCKTNSVTIPYSTPEIFNLFLKYMYSGEVEDKSWSSVKELFYFADKYEVRILKEECTDIAISLLSVGLVCEILKLAFVYNDLNLKSAAKNFSLSHMKEVISRDDWKELIAACPMIGYEVLTVTLSMDSTTDPQVGYKITSPSTVTSDKFRQTERLAEFVKNMKLVYNNGASELNDFVFKVGDKSLPAHRIVLAVHSPVLMKMFTQDFSQCKTNCVTISDSTPEIFDLFLKYMYSGEVEVESWSTVKELFYLANKYDVRLLKAECTDIIVSLLSVDLVCDVLKLAFLYDYSSLKSAARDFAANHIEEIISRDDWKDLVITHPTIGYEVTVYFRSN